MLDCVNNKPLNFTLNLKNNLGKNTNACVARSSFFFKLKIFMSVSPKIVKPTRLPVCLTKIKFPFIFILPSIGVPNRSVPLNPDVLFIKLSTTFFENLVFVIRIFFNLLGCMDLQHKAILLLHINKNE